MSTTLLVLDNPRLAPSPCASFPLAGDALSARAPLVFKREPHPALRSHAHTTFGRAIVFVAAFPTAHTLARLRIAVRVTAAVARLTTGWAGSPFAGRGSHPLDDEPNFMKSS